MPRKKEKNPLLIAHVGDVGSSRDMTMRIVSVAWISRHRNDVLLSAKPLHDFIDLSGGRDFLAEDLKYDVVILHYLWALDTIDVTPAFRQATATSPHHSQERWRERLAATDAEVIIAFGGGNEVARAFIGDIEGYKGESVFHSDPYSRLQATYTPPIQFGVWQKERA
jgi:hypothetical protein